jgi:hypothetical protein
MKNSILMAAFLLFMLAGQAQLTYKGLPVITTKAMQADYRVDTEWTRGRWGIAPEASPDVLLVPCFSRTVHFSFHTDSDSIGFPISGGQSKQFYVRTPDGQYALTEIKGFNYEPIAFNTELRKPAYRFWYESGRNEYLEKFRSMYPVEALVSGLNADSAKALRILHWVHRQWKHNGNNEPRKKDAISILEEVKEGKNFRCVEYGIVASTALNAIGLPARVLALKTKDVETTASGAGHVLLEVYLKDLKKWVLMDGQFDVMPVLDGVPLNAIEFQQAIAGNFDRLQLRSLSGMDKGAYVKWVYPYLYYFDVPFDNREGAELKKETHQGKPVLMLVPKDAKNPTIFQQKWPISNAVYTNAVVDFYGAPQEK